MTGQLFLIESNGSLRTIIESGLCIRKTSELAIERALAKIDEFEDWLRRRFHGFWRALNEHSRVDMIDLRKLVLAAQKDARSISQQTEWLGFITDICRWGEAYWDWGDVRESVTDVLPPVESEWSIEDAKQLQIAAQFEYAVQTDFGQQASEKKQVEPGLAVVQFSLATGITRLVWLERWLSEKTTSLHHSNGMAWLVYIDPVTGEHSRRLLDAVSVTAWCQARRVLTNPKSQRIKAMIGRYLASKNQEPGYPSNWKNCQVLIHGLMRVRQSELVAQLNGQNMPVVSLPEAAWRRNMTGMITPVDTKPRRIAVKLDVGPPPELAAQMRCFETLQKALKKRKSDRSFLENYEAQLHYGTHGFGVSGTLILSWACHLVRYGGALKSNLADATIEKYIGAIRPLIEYGQHLSLDELDAPGVLDDLFRKTYENAEENQLRFIAMFYRFVDEQDVFPELDLSWLSVKSSCVAVDANYLAPAHLDEVLSLLESRSIDPERRLGAQVAAILGYYAMLRRGEVMRLRREDVRLGPFLELLIQSTPEGKTKNRRGRRVRLALLAEHRAALEQYIRIYCQAHRPEDPLFGGRIYSRFTRQRRYLDPVRDAMREVTCDYTLRYHHLRHSGASTLIIQIALLLNCSEHDEDFRNWWFLSHPMFDVSHMKKRWAAIAELRDVMLVDRGTVLFVVAERLGHASPTTTLASYFHFPELLDHLSRPTQSWLPRVMCRGVLNYTERQTAYYDAQEAINAPLTKDTEYFYCGDGRQHLYGSRTDVYTDHFKLVQASVRKQGIPEITVTAAASVPVPYQLNHSWRAETLEDRPWIEHGNLNGKMASDMRSVSKGFANLTVLAADNESFQTCRRGLEVLRPPDGWELPGALAIKGIFTYVEEGLPKLVWRVTNLRHARTWQRILEGLPIPSSWWVLTWECFSEQTDAPEWAYVQGKKPATQVAAAGSGCARTGQLILSIRLPRRVPADDVRAGLTCWLRWVEEREGS